MSERWTPADMPNQGGRLALVTGANRGLGLEIAAGLAAAGATVVMACRDPARGREAAERVRQGTRNAELEVMRVDLADLAGISRFAAEFGGRFPKLDLLVNNASAILVPQGKTRDGFELQFGTNHLGAFALTGLLLDRLRAAPAARVVNMSSLSHRMTSGLDLDDLDYRRRPYKDMDAYGASKLATLLFTFELDRRVKRAGLPMTAAVAHPGWSNTNPDRGGALMRFANGLFAQSPAMGALPALYAATMPDVQGGDFFGPGGFQELKGFPRRVECLSKARDPDFARALWEKSAQLTGVRYLDA